MQKLNIPGFEGQNITVKGSSILRAYKLFINGEPALQGPKRRQFLLHNNDGIAQIARFKYSIPDPVPVLVVGEQTIRLAEPLTWYQWVWAAFPIVLYFRGGLIGVFLGLWALLINAKIFRSTLPGILKYLLSGIVTVLAIGIFILIALIIQG